MLAIGAGVSVQGVMNATKCKECHGPLPLRDRRRKGRIREYCGGACRMKALRKRNSK